MNGALNPCSILLTLLIIASSCDLCSCFQSTSLTSFSKTVGRRNGLLVEEPAQRRRHRQFSRHQCRNYNPQRINMIPEPFQAASEMLASGVVAPDLPFSEVAMKLAESLDVGVGLSDTVGKVTEIQTIEVLDSIGRDILVFLAASVIVTPLARALKVTPILGYLIIGAILGPNGLDVFANSRAGVELGDFGILFLLFSEGLEVSRSRLGNLIKYLPLGVAQISLVTGAITAALLFGGITTVGQYIPLDPSVIQISSPTEAVVLAFAGALSTSAFIFPVLKERGWEEEESGEAATSILLLQDLLVAPALVFLPYLVGGSDTDYGAIAFLTGKALIGFGSVMVLGSFLLQRLFALIARTESSETFVALCLLVSAGMGSVAKLFGLTDTAGAFAAGVLLANTNYRAQIQADILPFKGILLGIFFMVAGSNFDVNLVLSQYTTILAGSVALLLVKAVVVGLATRIPEQLEPNRLHPVDAIRVSLLLSGGGEFAFVVLALAEKLGIIGADLASVTTAIILITMGVTPLLGNLAAAVSEPYMPMKEDGPADIEPENTNLADDSIVVCGYGEVGRSVIRVLSEEPNLRPYDNYLFGSIPSVVAFDTLPSLVDNIVLPSNNSVVLFGNGANPDVLRSYGITNPSTVFIAYEDHSKVLAATARLRSSFVDTPIYARASTQREARQLKRAGVTKAVVEADELPRFAPEIIRGTWEGNLKLDKYENEEQLRVAASAASGMSLRKVDKLLEVYNQMDQDGTGNVKTSEVEAILDKSTFVIATDEEVKQLNEWIEAYLAGSDSVTPVELCCLYARAPEFVQRSFGIDSKKNKKASSERTAKEK